MRKKYIKLKDEEFVQMGWDVFQENINQSDVQKVCKVKHPIIDKAFNQNSHILNFSNKYMEGTLTLIPVDDVFHIEKQHIWIKEDLDLHFSYRHSHLEFNFPLEGNIELELGEKYMNSKGEKDVFALSAFTNNQPNNTRSNIYIKRGQLIRQTSFNLNINQSIKHLKFLSPMIKQDLNLYKVSGEDVYISNQIKYLETLSLNENLDKKEIQFILYDIIERSSAYIMGNKSYYACLTSTDLQVIKEVKRYINQYFLRDLSLAEISQYACENEYKLKKGYKEVYGETIFETIRRKRMHYARHLIDKGKNSLEEISYLCSYKSYPSFYKAFKHYYGKSPLAFKHI